MATVPPPTRKAALRRARELYEEFCERQVVFRFTEDYVAALPEVLRPFAGLAFDGFVRNIAEIIDRDSTREEDTKQPTLFDIGGVYKLGDGRRVSKRFAMITHAHEAMSIHDENLANDLKANARRHEELARLTPFWPMGTTKEQALAAYLAEHPEES